MSKRRKHDIRNDASQATVPQEVSPQEPKRVVPKARRCPVCHDNLGGIGKRRWQVQVNGPMKRRGYACDQCGATWTAEVETEVDEHGTEWVKTQITKVEADTDS